MFLFLLHWLGSFRRTIILCRHSRICGFVFGNRYFLIGFALSRFITASYTNAVFDRFINPRIEGAKVNQGLRTPEDDDDGDGADEADGKDEEG